MTQHARAIGKDKRCPICGQSFAAGVVNCPVDGILLTTVDPLVGQVLDGLEIVEYIGQGGMSVVYKAQHTLMERFVAVKILKPEYLSEVVNIQRFRREAQAASRLQHPNVNAIHNVGVTPSGQPYLVLEFLSGRSLAKVMEEEKTLALPRLLDIFSQIAEGLEHAHERGVIHRDLKPSNVVICATADGKELVKIVDFGLAKLAPQMSVQQQQLTQTGEVLGTLLYMSPEQKSGQEADARSDIYSLGCMLFECTEVDNRVPDSLKTIVEKATAENPADRFQTARQINDALALVSRSAGLKWPSSNSYFPASKRNTKPMPPYVWIVFGVLSLSSLMYMLLSEIDKARLRHALTKAVAANSRQCAFSADDLAGKIIDSHGNYREAESIYKQDALPILATATAIERARIYYGLGRAYAAMNDYTKACQCAFEIECILKKLEGIKGADADSVFSYLKNLQVEANCTEPVLVPKLDNLMLIADELALHHQPDQASAVYDKAQALASRSPIYNQQQLTMLEKHREFALRENRLDEERAVTQEMMQLLESTNKLRQSRYAVARLRYGEFLQMDGRLREAQDTFKDVIDSLPEGDPLQAQALIMLGIAANKGGRVDLAEHYLALAADLEDKLTDKQFTHLYYVLGDLWVQEDQFAIALSCLERAYKRYGNKIFGMPECSEFGPDMMLCLQKDIRDADAISFGETAVRELLKYNNCKRAIACSASKLGSLLDSDKRFEEGRKYFTVAYNNAETNSQRAEYSESIGTTYQHEAQFLVAEQYFRRAIQYARDASTPQYRLAVMQCCLVDCLACQHRTAEEIALMDEICASINKQLTEPGYILVLLCKVGVLTRQEDYAGAINLLKEAIRRRKEVTYAYEPETRDLENQLAALEQKVGKSKAGH